MCCLFSLFIKSAETSNSKYKWMVIFGWWLIFAERAVTTDGRYMFPAELVQGRFRQRKPLLSRVSQSAYSVHHMLQKHPPTQSDTQS